MQREDGAPPAAQPQKLIIPGGPGHGIEIEEAFAKLIPPEAFEKIETILGIGSPSDDIRKSLVGSFWAFYCNCLPEAETKISHAVLIRKLLKAADRAEELEKLAKELWASKNTIVIRELGEFLPRGGASQSLRSLRSGIAFADMLGAFALKVQCLAQTLPADPGGPRPAVPFELLIMSLAEFYRRLTGVEPRVTTQGRFFSFVCASVEALRLIEKRLPAARFRLPPNDKALYMRLQRLVT